ncbi:MAG: transglutaminase domain-containing protein [Prevotella sp.]|jgi:transglutaminase-like putative cysteine protease|nr:transglutaminase domain-containing protein [Prevotella sp.]
MKTHIISIIILSFLFSVAYAQDKVTINKIDNEIQNGNFETSKKLIDLYIAQNDLSLKEIYDLNARKDILDRIAVDFSKSKSAVTEFIKKYYPDVNDKMLSDWEAEKSLESMVINGEKKYLGRAAPNLFRINKDAIKRKLEVDGDQKDEVQKVLETHLLSVVNELKKNGKVQTSPVKMKVKYIITLKPNVVPAGEMVRCWLPYPREDNRRQTDVKLLSVNDNNYIISPADYAQRTLYMQKVAEKDKPLTFSFEFSYASAAEWFNIKPEDIKPYNINTDLYKEYTSERDTHIIFTDRIKELSQKIIGNESNPYLKVKKIFDYIADNYPWAGAREYSTIPNISEYVIENGHGDCGQVALLFITLARYNGIPAKWQSGFMMHPDALNLHDWAEVYFEGIGWVPVDQSFGRRKLNMGDDIKYFYANGIDAYRWIVNDDYSRPLFPEKIYTRSETVDFQRGELEWRGGNIYFDQWNWDFDVEYLD